MLLIIFGLFGGWIALLTVCIAQFIQLRQVRCQRDFEWNRAEVYLNEHNYLASKRIEAENRLMPVLQWQKEVLSGLSFILHLPLTQDGDLAKDTDIIFARIRELQNHSDDETS